MSQNVDIKISKEEKKFQLNMEILSSIKPLKGKIVNLQSDNLFQKKEKGENNKINLYTEDLLSTSYSIPIISKLKNQNKSYTTNSAFKPISLNHTLDRVRTLNYYNPGCSTFMSYPNILFENQNIVNQNLIINPLINQNTFFNSFYVNENPFQNTLNPIYRINNEEKKDVKKINISKDNIVLNKKRKSEIEIIYKKDENIIKNNYLKNKIINKSKKNVIFATKKDEERKNIPNKLTISPKKCVFNVYKKSKYIFKKRKKRIEKELNKKKINEINCGHKGCEGVLKTKKQFIFHHYKMSIDCHNDSIYLLKMISNVKRILLKIDKKNKEKNIIKKYSSLYKETMENICLDEHIETIVGFNLEK